MTEVVQDNGFSICLILLCAPVFIVAFWEMAKQALEDARDD